MTNKWQLLAAKPAKSAKYTSSAFRGKKVKIMHAMTYYAKTYVNLIYQSLVAEALKSWAQERTRRVLLTSTCIAGYEVNHPKFEWRNVTSIKFLKSFFRRCFVLIARPRVRTRTYPRCKLIVMGRISPFYILLLLCYSFLSAFASKTHHASANRNQQKVSK